jgi:signal peptidase
LAHWTILRRSLLVLWAGLLLSVLALVFASHIAPMLGQQLFIIRGSSMSPTIPLGSVVSVRQAAPETIEVGDVITVRAENSVLFTHRVVRTAEMDGQWFFETKGDANQSADPAVAPASAVIGVAHFYVPYVGFVQSLLGRPSGMVTVASLLTALLVGIHLMDHVVASSHAARKRQDPRASAA